MSERSEGSLETDDWNAGLIFAARVPHDVTAELAPGDLDALLDTDESVRVVDIRSPEAFARGHVPGSENVPFAELAQGATRFSDAERVVTVCPHGKASLKAARLLESAAGVDARVESLAGGLDAWDGTLESNDAPNPADERPETPF